MDLQPLPNNGDISPDEFRRLFDTRLGDLAPRAMAVLTALGPMHSFSVANVLHMALQKGIAELALTKLERASQISALAPDEITRHVDLKIGFDILYQELFFTSEDTIGGLGPFEVVEERGNFRSWGVAKSSSKLWTPGGAA